MSEHRMFDTGEKCVYLHRDKRDVFYVGMGTIKRAFSRSSRNKDWHSRVDSNNGKYDVIVFESGITLEEACQLEKELIAAIGLDSLTNRSTGGEHASEGMRHSEESKRKISLNSASKRPEFRKRVSEMMRGSKNPMFGRTHDMAARECMRDARSDKTLYQFTFDSVIYSMTRKSFRDITGANIQQCYDVVKRNCTFKGWRLSNE